MSTAQTITGPTRFMINFAGMLVDDIDADRFADRLGTSINHPAFVLGHLGYYAGVAMTFLGGDPNFGPDEAELYEHGKECEDDASKYPSKDEAIAAFNARINAAADYIEACDESAFEASSEGTPFESRFPTMGAVAAFMLIGHVPFHLGQISAWRRVAGMGSAS